ncbi:hypothetical protein CCACVL1_09516 [Corchorus capsularis]|uniref:F-box domain-containing protein n=1 Tax=Corchorus capsularis TaxID=210143 RepID=A0A1R3IW14_COCAP|nr:hypothetical protein CCACVL1_09516 [Corchorus capsularis]
MVIVEELSNSKKVKIEGNTRVGINELPDEILCHILSFLQSEEAVGNSLVSRRWRNLWKLCRSFNFYGSNTKHGRITPIMSLRSEFEERVNNVLQSYQGFNIPELRLCFDLDKSSLSHINKWIEIALTKKVKKLELDFTPFSFDPRRPKDLYYPFPQECFPCTNFLTCLSLSYLNVNDEILGSILSNFPMLEVLLISKSPLLRNAIVSALRLKQLSIFSCRRLLANAFPYDQLVTLTLRIIRFDTQVINWQSIPKLTSLRHLTCEVTPFPKNSLLLTSLIEASPFLHKFKLNTILNGRLMEGIVEQKEVNGQPNKYLKEVEIIGFCGSNADVEIVTYLLKTAIMLEKIVIKTKSAAAKALAHQLVKNHACELRLES